MHIFAKDITVILVIITSHTLANNNDSYRTKQVPDDNFNKTLHNGNVDNLNKNTSQQVFNAFLKNIVFGEYEYNENNIKSKNNLDYDQNKNKIFDENDKILGLMNFLGFKNNFDEYTYLSPIIPQYMKELYGSISDSKTGVLLKEKPHGAQIVRSLLEQSPMTEGLFKFDLSTIEPQEVILEAELHVYRKKPVNYTLNNPQHYFLRVYQIMPSYEFEIINPDVHQLLGVHYVSSSFYGRQIFKVKRTVDTWRNGTSANLGFFVSATSVFGDLVHVEFYRRGMHANEFQPILVVFSKTPHKSSDTETSNCDHSHLKSTQIIDEVLIYNSPLFKNRCKKTSMQVNFFNLGWANWIISPKMFEAYQCSGSCELPLKDYPIITNHAAIQNVFGNIPASCVPTELSAVVFLFYDMRENVVIKSLENVFVHRCGCV